MKSWKFALITIIIMILLLSFASCSCDEDDEDDDSKPSTDDDDDDDDNDDNDDDSTDDDDDDTTTVTCYEDLDRDGYGNPDESQDVSGDSCPDGWVEDDTDCDDTYRFINPGAFDFPDDGIPQDCDGIDFTVSDSVGVFVDGAVKGADKGTCGSMADPCSTIEDGIMIAKDENPPKAVFVAQGLYEETLETTVSIFGGYNHFQYTHTWTRDPVSYPTRINRGMTIKTPAKYDKDTPLVVLEGLSIEVGVQPRVKSEGSEKTKDEYYGVLVENYTNTIVAHNSISNQMPSDIDFRGVYISGWYQTDLTEATILENTIHTGTISSAGDYKELVGIGARESVVTVWDNTITCGNAEADGSWIVGIYIADDTVALVANNLITLGSATMSFSSEGIRITGTDTLATVVNNVILGSSHEGTTIGFSVAIIGTGGVVNLINNTFSVTTTGPGDVINPRQIGVDMSGGTLIMVNNIIDGTSTTNCYGLEVDGTDLDLSIELISNDFFLSGTTETCLIKNDENGNCLNDLPTVETCGWWGCQEASDNMSVDPDFDTDGYHLKSTSQCKDGGLDPASWYSEGLADLDMDAERRPAGSSWDIGADEYTAK